jgi:CRP-like cAMP-binding protein
MPDPQRSSLMLRRVPLLDGLSDERLDSLAQLCVWRSLDAGKPVLARNDDKGGVFFVISGRVRATIHAANGRQVTFRDLCSGDHFGDLAAIDGQPRSVDVVTLEPSVVAGLAREHFLDLLQQEPKTALRVMAHLAQRVRQLSERVIELSTLGVQNRLHAELLRLARDAGVQGNRARLDPAPRHVDLAAQVSTNREQITRELSALTRRGLLQKDGKALLVLDVAELARMVAEVQGEPR